MGTIGYGYGSEWHMLRYLGYHREELSQYVLNEINSTSKETRPDAAVRWLDTGFAVDPESCHDDSEWLGIDFLHDASVKAKWNSHWPSRAQHWDAIAQLKVGTESEWLLVEAKAHVAEMSSACRAKSQKSIDLIDGAMVATAARATNHGSVTAAWKEVYYQYANRLVMLDFLTELQIDARLVLIHFYKERSDCMPGCDCPTTAAEWDLPISAAEAALDLDLNAPLMKLVHHVKIPIYR